MSYRIEMPMTLLEDGEINLARYRPRGRISLFDYMRNYFNERVGREIYRKQMMMDIIGAGYNERTIDTYRSYFTSACYLMIIDRGYYHVIKEIPHGMILADLKWEAEKKSFERNRVKRIYTVKPFIEKGEFHV